MGRNVTYTPPVGDLIYLNALGTDILVLNKREDAEELLERRARSYSGRTQIPAMRAMGWDTINIVFMDYGEEWRAHRKACQQLLNLDKTRSYEDVYLRHVHKLLERLLDSPEDFMHYNELFPIGITLDALYGYQVDSLDDPVVVAAQKSAEGTSLLTPSAAYMNIFPFLRHIPPWIPGSMARRKAEKYAHWTREMQRIPLEDRENTAAVSTISDMLERKSVGGVSPEEEKILYNVAYTLYGAAGETTVSSTGTFLHMIATHPAVQKKAQEEIDRVIGTQFRLPTFGDRASLPYVEAIYREVMRYNPPGHLGVPHKTTEDDVYKGYFIPKGTAVFSNIWAMTHDEEKYADPHEFKPERFLDENGQLNDDARVLAYGFGRRACVGKYVASATERLQVWIAIVSILACFTISKAEDEHGNEIEIDDEYEDNGGGVHKKPFKCSIVPRSDLVRKLIEEVAKTE
ncbi:hypothetical protein NLJ89_g7173 [Agrocybe chaxingu]|uniref:Cytochrome P450 n=1 Tax=Agrocybe chaxingu TaxID=84603 RepID=A0A9W8JV13_9AGAR|nr:hypothetical protein NLJ89_g7173 [Agrocybe chaxingu]